LYQRMVNIIGSEGYGGTKKTIVFGLLPKRHVGYPLGGGGRGDRKGVGASGKAGKSNRRSLVPAKGGKRKGVSLGFECLQ